MLNPGLIEQFTDRSLKHLQPVNNDDEVHHILKEFKRLRTTDETTYMRNGSINLINGMISMTFSCDG